MVGSTADGIVPAGPLVPRLGLRDGSYVVIACPDIDGLICEMWCYEGAGAGIGNEVVSHRQEEGGVLVLVHEGDDVTLTTRLTPEPGGIDIAVTAEGPRTALAMAFPQPGDPYRLDLGSDGVLAPGAINPCWQFKRSPTFGCADRDDYVTDFVARCFVFLANGLTLMKDTARIPGSRPGRPLVNQADPWIQEYVPI